MQSMLGEPSASRAIGIMYKLGMFSSIFRVNSNVSNCHNRNLGDENEGIQKNLSYGVAKSMVVSELCRLICNDSRVSLTLHIHGNDARLLRMAALISYLADLRFMHSRNMKKSISLSDYVLIEDLKFNKKDKNAVNTLIEASKDFRIPVRKTINDSDDNGMTRLELGKAVRKAGPNYQYALALAIASEILESTQSILSLTEYSDIVDVIFSNFDCFCEYVAYNVNEKTTEFEHTVLRTISERTEAGSTCFVDLVKLIQMYEIEDSWALKPLCDGNFITENFPDIPRSRLSGVMQLQIDWMIEYPSGTVTELCQYIHEHFKDHI